MSDHAKLEILEQKHALKVLVLLSGKEMFKGELASKITIGTASIQARVQDLINLGLIREEHQSVKPFKKYLSLTEKGEEIAKLVREIESLL